MRGYDLSEYIWPEIAQRRQPQHAVRLAEAFADADFAWTPFLRSSIKGPSVSLAGSTNIKPTLGGLAIQNGYATVSAPIPSQYSTNWTECGVVLLDGTNSIETLSSRGTGQAIIFNSTNIDIVMWAVADVFINIAPPKGIVSYVVRRNGSVHNVWLNGSFFGSVSNASAPLASSGILPAIGAQAGSGGYSGTNPLTSTTGVLCVIRTPRTLSDGECLRFSGEPYAAFEDPILPIPISSSLYPTLSNLRFNPATSTGGYLAVDMA